MALDPVIHAPVRLRVVTLLAAALRDPADEIPFVQVQRELGLTAGNLTTHLAKLEDAGYVAIGKEFQGRKPVTHVSLTAPGRLAFAQYRAELLSLLSADEVSQ
ncbi:transcriptional regulator [Microbacterium halophytorum]|uniref:transcriptional regulator n=1 Tax=Microbacterium halophytorum TaxID=2067568 RepID=UPI000CFADDE0|nr:transcriptional regulator [Microbacterium halophytorum]